MIKNLVMYVAVTAALLFSSSTVASAASYYKVMNHPNPVTVTCTTGDVNCGFVSAVIFQNVSGKDLYDTTFWTDTAGIKFTGIQGTLTDKLTVFPGINEPGYGPNILVSTKVTPEMTPGSYTRRIYVDAKTCNQIGTYMDCYYGGASGALVFTVTLQVVPKPVVVVKPPVVATPRPVIKPSIPVPQRRSFFIYKLHLDRFSK